MEFTDSKESIPVVEQVGEVKVEMNMVENVEMESSSHSVPISHAEEPKGPIVKENIDTPTKHVSTSHQSVPRPAQPPLRSPNVIVPRGSKRNGCRNVSVYERGDVIGQGTYGTVFKAKDPVTGKPVAIKKLNLMVRNDVL